MRLLYWTGVVFSLALIALGAACSTPRAVRQLPVVREIVGPTPPTFSMAVMGIKTPQGLGISSDSKRLYVAEGDGDRAVLVIDLQTGEIISRLTPPKTDSGDRKPVSIAVSQEGIIYAVDRLRGVVDTYDPQDNWLGVLADPPGMAGTWRPLAVDVTSDGGVYVTNAGASATMIVIAEYSSIGTFETVFDWDEYNAGSPPSFPAAISTTRNGEMFLADSNNGRVIVMDEDGQAVGIHGVDIGESSLAIPRGSAVDLRGYYYVTDVTGHTVKVWDVSTNPANFLFSFGDAGFADGELLYPNDIVIAPDGTIYVADTGNDRVHIWRY